MLVFHRGLMKYILSDRDESGGVSAMRGVSGGVNVDGVTVDGVTVDGFRGIPAGVYLWWSRQGARRHRLV